MNPEDILRKYYGYRSFRPGQAEVIAATLSGRDSVVLMPTGGGKSVCYQIPALSMPGCAIVVSPLIALMNDQVGALRANGIPAAAIHSNRDESENRRIMDEASEGRLKILYISPERIAADIDVIRKGLKVSMVAIDEAHCISQWGHDFRPVYTSLKIIKETFQDVPVMALTATADRLTRSDITTALRLEDPFCWTGSFDRPNISLSVIPDPGKRNRLKVIRELSVKYPHGAGIVYCISRKKTEETNKALNDLGLGSVCYHAGMTPAQREASQKAFVSGEARIVCATIAFGMGIDKSNIRWVVHNNMPGNIESYYQEIGRAGRDGLPSEAIMFYNYSDYIMRRNFAEESGQAGINCEKLDFMQKYAEASVCRRRILLSYFSEESEKDCGNCDNCRNPRSRIDGTIIAQKVLSAVIRTGAREGAAMIVDILRASAKKELFEKRYDKLKTYGVGRDLSPSQWHVYILQMIQLGLLEVAFEDNSHLRPTALGMKVVRGLSRISLSPAQAWSPDRKRARTTPASQVTVLSPDERLLDTLMTVRKKIAEVEKTAPHSVFNDATLADMVARKPTTLEELLTVNGVSEYKAVRFGKKFYTAVRRHQGMNASLPTGTSQKESLILFESGMTPGEIADLKGVKTATIYSHLIGWSEQGTDIDFSRLVTPEELNAVREACASPAGDPFALLAAEGIPSHIARAAMRMLAK